MNKWIRLNSWIWLKFILYGEINHGFRVPKPEFKSWLLSYLCGHDYTPLISSSSSGQWGHTLPSFPLSRCPKTQKSDSSSEWLSCLHPLTPPLPSSLSPTRVKMKTTVSISARDGRMEVKKSSWEKEKWGPWGRKRGESFPWKTPAYRLEDQRGPQRTSNAELLSTDVTTKIQRGKVFCPR